MCSPILHVLYPSHAIALISITFISDIIVSNNIKVNTMDNLDDSELRLLKHPRWSPSPVDLSIANVVPPASALIASLGMTCMKFESQFH